MMGRPRKYATAAAKKRAKSERDKQRPLNKVYMGKVMNLWNRTKDTTGITSGAGFAKFLLDRLVTCYYSASTVIIIIEQPYCSMVGQVWRKP